MNYFKKVISVKPYVAKYIKAQYSDPFIITNTNYLGAVIYSMLQKKNALNLHIRTKDERFDLLTDKITVLIPAHRIIQRRTGIILDKEHSLCINHLIEKKMMEELYAWFTVYEIVNQSGRIYKMQNNKGFKIKDALAHFCDRYKIDLENDINIDAIIKNYARYKIRMGKALQQHA